MEIKDFFTRYQQAAWYKDAAAMIALYDPQAVIFDMWDEGYQRDGSAWAASIRDWFGGLGDEKVRVEFEMIDIHHAGVVGFASALVKYQAIAPDGAVVRGMKNRMTLGFAKREDGWKVTHQHTSAPVSSNGLMAILDI